MHIYMCYTQNDVDSNFVYTYKQSSGNDVRDNVPRIFAQDMHFCIT